MTSRSDAGVSAPTITGSRVALVLPVGQLGVALLWLGKGLASLCAGDDASYWGDDLVYGAVCLGFAVLWWILFRRGDARRVARAASGGSLAADGTRDGG
jgi:hypothetical protein